MLAFATCAIREAPNGEEVLAHVRATTGVDLQVLPARTRPRLTFLAVRRWFGWSAGRLLVLDIGGGSLEMAAGIDEVPDVAVSLPLGAGRLTREWLRRRPAGRRGRARRPAGTSGPRSPGGAGRDAKAGAPDLVVGTTKTFRSPGPDLRCRAERARGRTSPRKLRRADARRPGAEAGRDDRRGAGRAARRVGRAGPASCWPGRSSRTPRWTCSASRSSRSARGRCARASSCAAWTAMRRVPTELTGAARPGTP